MPAVVTDQFRIVNAGNFVDSVLDSSNSYYVFLGLPNPSAAGFGRTTSGNPTWPSDPVDNHFMSASATLLTIIIIAWGAVLAVGWRNFCRRTHWGKYTGW